MTRLPEPTGSVIRITPEELADPHVDDLLKRQASLRGEAGITRSHRRRWYYSNWFIFSVAGALGALVAWALVEPFCDDLIYIQGEVAFFDEGEPWLGHIDVGHGQGLDMPAPLEGLRRPVKVAGQPVWILKETRPLHAKDRQERFDPDRLRAGDEIGVYVAPLEVPNVLAGSSEVVGIAVLVDTEPPPGKATHQSLEELAGSKIVGGMLLFPAVAALVGLAIGAADGLVCRLWRRLLLAGIVGLLAGFIGGFVSQTVAGLVYMPLSLMALRHAGEGFANLTTTGFVIQTSARGLAWCLAGMAMGLGQGIALRSGRLLLYGFLGGAIGGLLGGLLFDPIDLILLGADKPSAHVSRLVGLTIIGCSVGLMIGIVELLARDAWLRMLAGPLAGKEFLLFKDLMRIGASPQSDIYLFNDDEVAERHALIRAASDQYEIEALDPVYPVLINGRPLQRARLRSGDQIMLGKTVFSFHRRRTEA